MYHRRVHMLTGRPPFVGETDLDTLVQLLSREPGGAYTVISIKQARLFSEDT